MRQTCTGKLYAISPSTHTLTHTYNIQAGTPACAFLSQIGIFGLFIQIVWLNICSQKKLGKGEKSEHLVLMGLSYLLPGLFLSIVWLFFTLRTWQLCPQGSCPPPHPCRSVSPLLPLSCVKQQYSRTRVCGSLWDLTDPLNPLKLRFSRKFEDNRKLGSSKFDLLIK